MSNSSIWPIDRTLSDATTTGQSGFWGDDNEGVLHISQSSSFTGVSASDCLMSYPGHSLVGSYSSAEMQSIYSAAQADCACSTPKRQNPQDGKFFTFFFYVN